MKIFFLGLSLIVTQSFARGGIDGGGGNALVCRGESGEITSARMFDLYEGEVMYGLSYEPLQIGENQKLREIFENIEDLGHLANNDDSPLDTPRIISDYEIISSLKSSFRFLPTGVALKPIEDSEHIIVPVNCKIEQVANFYNQRNIYIVSDIYKKFSPLDRLALLLHEGIFMLERENNVKNSRYARRVVAHLLSKGFVTQAPREDVDGSKDIYCSTFDILGDQDQKVTSFFATRFDRDWRFSFIEINGHKVYSKKYVEFKDRGLFPITEQESRLIRPIISVAQLDSKIDGGEVISFNFFANTSRVEGRSSGMSISWVGFDPGDKKSNIRFQCTPQKK